MNEKQSLDPEYFKKVYEANDDPWDFETSDYEAEKYKATIKALPKEWYQNALEIGCSIGVLTKLLEERCNHLIATDVSQKALDKAMNRCKNLDNITFSKAKFPQDLPDQKFDLIIISEVAYYLSPEDWEKAMEKLLNIIDSNGTILLCHWLPEVHDYPQTGDEIHNSFAKFMHGKMQNVFNAREENYRIDVWETLEQI